MSLSVDYLPRLCAWGALFVLVQGSALAFGWVCLERALRDSRPQLRYRLLCVHLAAFAGLPVLSVAVVHGLASKGLAGASADTGGHVGAWTLARPMIAAAHLLFAQAWQMAAVWAAGAALSVAMLAQAWRALRRLRYVPAAAPLRQLVEVLSGELGLRRAPAVLHAPVGAPYVVGMRRPAVVLPAGIDSHLPAAELRAVLLHELAHVQRADFFWNLVQRGLCGCLWFHPGAWFLYARVRREREWCCDAVAARHGAASDLCRGLLRLARHAEAATPSLAPASLSGSLERRFRELLAEKRGPSQRGRLLAGATPLLLFVLMGWLATAGARDAALRSSFVASPLGPVVSIDAHDDAGSFELKMQHGRVLAVAFEHRQVAAARILQSGHSVSVLSETGTPLLALQVDPGGGVSWQSRPAPLRQE